MTNEIPFPEIRELLASPELQAVEESIAVEAHLEIRPCVPNLLMSIQGQLRELQLTTADVLHILKVDREQLINFGIELLQLDDSDGEEFAPGEELSEDEEPEIEESAATANGFGIGYLCYWWFLRNHDENGLVNFLRFERIPHHKKFAKQLLAISERLI